MNKKDKDLLLKDLSARLPYNVIVDYSYNAFDVHNGNYVKHGSKCILRCYLLDVFMSPRQNEEGEYIKPYLRPMSSMTEEEFLGYFHKYSKVIPKNEWKRIDVGRFRDVGIIPIDEYLDWLNAHHFDFRNLIEKGLALEAPKGMYKQ